MWEFTLDQSRYVTFAKEIQLPLNRNGGDATTRYNWNVRSVKPSFLYWCSLGWFIKFRWRLVFCWRQWPKHNNTWCWPWLYLVLSSSIKCFDYLDFISTNQGLGITSTITIPMIQYINKESEYHCSFPKSIYPNQQEYNPYIHPNGDYCVRLLLLVFLT